MGVEIDKILNEFRNENEQLRKIMEERERLLSSPFTDTSKEKLDKLSEIVSERNVKLEKIIKAINSDLGTNIDISNVLKGLEELQDKLNNTKESYNDTSEKIRKLNKEIRELKKNKKDTTAKENEREIELEKQEQSLKLIKELEKAVNSLSTEFLNYTTAGNEQLGELNKRIVEGTTGLDDFSEKWEQKTKALKKGAQEIEKGAKGIFDAIKGSLEPWSKANQEAMTYARSMGMSKRNADSFLSNTVTWAAKNDIGLLFNKTTDELIKMQGKYSEVLGRNVQLTSEQKMDMLAMETFLGEDGMSDIANNLENFGLGMSDSSEFIKKTMDDATKSGIVASKLTKTIRENIKMAQNYTFKNGLDGLTSMAKKAIELKTDMSLINSFADKVSTVEGAITTGANLQVLGGSYAMGSNPLSMLYESLYDMEGLFDRAVGMVKEKAFFNEKTGNFELGAFDRRMIKEYANQTGMDYGKLVDVAFRQSSMGRIENQIKQNEYIADDKELVDLVKNLATFNNGKAVINIDGEDVDVSKIRDEHKEKLLAMQRNDSQNLQEMAINLRSLNEIASGVAKNAKNLQADTLAPMGEKLAVMLSRKNVGGVASRVIEMQNILKWGFASMTAAYTMTNGGIRLFKGARNIFRPRPSGGSIPTSTPPSGSGVGTSMGSSGIFSKGTIVGGGITAGALAAGVSLYSDYKSGELERDTGFSVGRAAGVGVGAGVGTAAGLAVGSKAGAAIGTLIAPGIGTAIGWIIGAAGGAVGGLIGKYITDEAQEGLKRKRQELRKEIAERLRVVNSDIADLFVGESALKGNYRKKQLNKLEDALSDGVIDENDNLNRAIRRKARANGDFQRMSDAGIRIEGIEMATGGMLVGKSHNEGGMPILGSNIVVEGGEYVINKEATKQNLPILERINSGNLTIKANEPLGKQLSVYKNNYNNFGVGIENTKVDIKPISINLSGTIKLDSGNRQFDITNELLNNPQIITKLTEMISKQINILDNGSYNKGVFKQKFA